MARDVTGSVYESPKGSGHWHGKFPTPKGRKSVLRLTCRSRDEAIERRDFIARELARLRDAGRFEHAEKLLELAAVADEKLRKSPHRERPDRGIVNTQIGAS